MTSLLVCVIALLTLHGALSVGTFLGAIAVSLCAIGLALNAGSPARARVAGSDAEDHIYRLLAACMSDVMTRHGRNGEVTFVSSAAEKMFGVKGQTLLGQALFERVHVADRPAYLTALSDTAASGEMRSAEFRVRCDRTHSNDGRGDFVWIEMRCGAIDMSSAPEGARGKDVVAVLRDVTCRKIQERRIESAHAEAKRANAAKSQFLATMSHELRTPLNAIIGFSEMLGKEAALQINAQRRQEYAHLINESGHHLLSMVNGILDMSKIETGHFQIAPESFSPRQVIADCRDLLALKATEADIELVMEIPHDLPDIVADKRSLSQIMLNLMSNAIKFSDHGGKVTVGAKSQDASLVVTVEDSGVGIGGDDLPRIGDPFFQARSSYDRRHDGTGLGLSIVKGLLKLHGGELDIASKLGVGTRVTVRLPMNCESTAAGRPRTPCRKVVSHPNSDTADNRVKISA